MSAMRVRQRSMTSRSKTMRTLTPALSRWRWTARASLRHSPDSFRKADAAAAVSPPDSHASRSASAVRASL